MSCLILDNLIAVQVILSQASSWGVILEGESWLFTGFELDLFPYEADGYYLNVSATSPSWFVMWRLEEDVERYIDEQSLALAKAEASFAVPYRICVSYNEAARLLDGGESAYFLGSSAY